MKKRQYKSNNDSIPAPTKYKEDIATTTGDFRNRLNEMKMLGNFNAEVGREDIFKPTGNKRLHEIGNDNGVRIVNFATSKNLTVKNTTFPHHNINKFTWTSHDGKTHKLTVF
jgi:hypothetical protein